MVGVEGVKSQMKSRPEQAMKAQRTDTSDAYWKHIKTSVYGIQREDKH